MPSSSKNPQPERHESIQERYKKAVERISLDAFFDRPDVPPRAKLTAAVFRTATTGFVTLGISRAPWEAYGFLLACTLAIEILTNETRQSPRRAAKGRTSAPKPRPRRRHKGKLRGPP